MQKLADIYFQDNKFFVTGSLDFSNVMALYKKSMLEMQKVPDVTIDFGKLKSSNSAGFALLIEWIKFAKRYHKTISFINLPDDILLIAKTAGLDKLIGNKEKGSSIHTT